MTIFKRPIFWIAFFLASVLGGFFSYQFFPKAFPLVSLDIKMNRSEALKKATEISTLHHLGPEGFSQAASFDTDQAVKTFVELEAGGKEAFAQMLKDPYYAPYTWTVRHFKEFEKNESIIRIKPDGTPYGFVETLSENAPGAALEANPARLIAQEAAQKWHINLQEYKLVEESKEVRPSKRIDHLFVYERQDVRIGDGYYRLRISVSGDKVTEITHYVKVPEAFVLKYMEMRSANNAIATAAKLAMRFLYILGGCIIGFFFLVRRRYAIWHPAVKWGIFVATLMSLTEINQLPLMWMHYDTALSMQGFLLRFIISLLAQFLYLAVFYSLAFMAAETFTRAAFGNHIQFWKSWSKNVANTPAMLGRTVGGYLMVGIELAYSIGFYVITTKFFGWWVPSEALVDPNVLATYFPWLTSISLSLSAGFMEECLFRAIPIAGAALLGKRFGRPGTWLITGFILQAIIFGAAHANYPSFPAYARLVELIIFSLVNGLIYLYFGLIPAIISHFTYDVLWFSIPLFVSSAAFAWVNQLLVILLTLTPLWIVLWRRLQMGAWIDLSPIMRNSAWQPAPITQIHEPIDETPHQTFSISTNIYKILWAAGGVGLLLWLFTTQFIQDGQPVALTLGQTVEQGQTTLATRGITLPTTWQALPNIADDFTANLETELRHQFIWQKGGKEVYKKLLSTYLTPPRFTVRFITFSPAVPAKDRAEEYQMSFIAPGAPYRFIHSIPEERPGAELSEQEARVIVHEVLKKQYNLDPATLEEISAVAEKQPARKNWMFTYAHHEGYPLKEGQARIVIRLDGSEIVDTFRYVHIPEQWERDQINKKNLNKILNFICSFLLYVLLSCGIFILCKYIPLANIMYPAFYYALTLLIIAIIKFALSWPGFVAEFNTSEPFMNQVFMRIGGASVGLLIQACLFGLILAAINLWKRPYSARPRLAWITGTALGLFAAGVHSLARKIAPSTDPLWADYSALDSYMPLITILIGAFMMYITFTATILLLYIILDYVSNFWRDRHTFASAILIAAGITLTGMKTIENIPLWLLSGTLLGILFLIMYAIYIRFDRSIIPIATCSFLVCQLTQQAMFNAFPLAIVSNVIACGLIIILAYIWHKKLAIA